MKKYYFLFLSLIVCIALSSQNKQSCISILAQSESLLTKLFHSQFDSKQQQHQSTLQRMSQVRSESNVLKQQLDSMVQPGYKTTLTYDVYGRMLTRNSWYDSTNGWSEMYKDSSVYNTNGQLIRYIEFEKDVFTNTLALSYTSEYEYNTNDKTKTKYSWNADSKSWMLRYKTVDTYDTTGKTILAFTSLWNINSWTDEKKTVYEYDTNANKTVETFYIWWSDKWLNSSKTIYNYDVHGNALGETNFSWNSITQTWIESYKNEYLLDSNFNISTEISYSWNTSTELWEQSSKAECFYDLNTLVSDVFSNGILNVFGKHKLTSAKLYSYDGTNWVFDGLAITYFSTHDFQSGTKTVVEDAIKVYPNPASDFITFNVDKSIGQFTIQLIDLQGKIVLNKTSNNNNALSIDKLSKGLYLYKILSDTKIYTGKIIVK